MLLADAHARQETGGVAQVPRLFYEDPNFLKTWDDDYDSTYGYYEFKVPDKWRSDFDKVVAGEAKSVSEEYKALLMEFFPKLTPTVFGLG